MAPSFLPDAAAHNPVLMLTLDLAMPIAILQMRDWTPRQRETARAADVDMVASHGDDLLFGGRNCTAAFAAAARGLALLADAPGGVDFAGRHWCVRAHPQCPNASRRHAPS